MSALRCLSLGAGVQSSTIALMSARGDLPKLDCAIFADTGGEPRRVYEWLDWLEQQLPFPIIRARRPGVTLGDLSIGVADGSLPRGSIPPWYLRAPDGSMSMLPKQCSKEFKTRVIQAEVRKLIGLKARERAPQELRVEQWIGISLDESHRMKPSELSWIDNRWPLIDFGMKRRACLQWMEDRQFPRPPKSSCIYCPFRGDQQWRDMRDHDPEDWLEVVAFDRAIRPGWPGMTGAAFVHRSGVPLDQADLSTWAERGQPDLFGEECEGVCGV